MTFWGWGHSATPQTLLGSIWIVLFSKMTPRNSMRICLKEHFSSFRNRSCWCNLSSTWWTLVQCRTISNVVAISISSMYTISHPTLISSSNIAFVIIWKVAGELVRPKNMTRGSNNPLFVTKAAFHSSPSLIRKLLYPHLTSNLVKSVLPLVQLMSWGISGRVYLLRIVHWLSQQ